MRAARGLPSGWGGLRRGIPALAFALACSACAGGPAEGDGTVVLSFRPDEVQLGGEDYLCFGLS